MGEPREGNARARGRVHKCTRRLLRVKEKRAVDPARLPSKNGCSQKNVTRHEAAKTPRTSHLHRHVPFLHIHHALTRSFAHTHHEHSHKA
eukprot:scaffold34469_cov34-Tisochrysis_lutea.AAC.2